MTRGRTKDWGIVALLVLGGVALAALGFLAWSLEREGAVYRAGQRAADELNAARTRVEGLLAAPSSGVSLTTPERWYFDPAEPPSGSDYLQDPIALVLAEAQHLLQVRKDPAASLALLEPALSTGPPLRAVVALRAGDAAAELKQPERAANLWRAAASAHHAYRFEGAPIRVLASYRLCLADVRAGRVSKWLRQFVRDCSEGRMLRTGDVLQPADLLGALAKEAKSLPSTPELERLRRAAQHAHLGLSLLTYRSESHVELWRDHVVWFGPGTLHRAPVAWLARGYPQTEMRRRSKGPVAAGALTARLPAPLDELRLETVPVVGVVPGALALVGTLAVLCIYAAGAFFIVGAMRRSRRTAQMQNKFVASVSHELKTPIASVRAMAELLGDGVADDPKKTRQYAEHIEHEMQRLGATVRNVLDVARIEQTGRLPIRLTPGDPAEVIRSVAASFAPLLDRRGFKFRVNAASATTLIPLDKEALRGVLVNLLDNATKYSTGPTKEITVTGTELDDDIGGHDMRGDGIRGTGYRIEVADRGMGFDAAEARALFDRFHRSKRAGKAALPGVGLGLHVVQEVVRAHEGSVKAVLRPEGGSVFTVTLNTRGHARARRTSRQNSRRPSS